MSNWAGLTGEMLEAAWPDCAPLLKKALERTGMDKDWDTVSVYEHCQRGDMQCWVAHEEGDIVVVAITQIMEYPLRKVLGIPFAGAKFGSIGRWLPHMGVMHRFASANDCEVIRGWGRKGWERTLSPDVLRIEFDIEVQVEVAA